MFKNRHTNYFLSLPIYFLFNLKYKKKHKYLTNTDFFFKCKKIINGKKGTN